jgi:F0F1-type ATP synthase delta subunit
LIEEFLEKLKGIDMSRISPDITSVDVVTLEPVAEKIKVQIAAVIKEKIGRSLTVNSSTNQKMGGGLILKFGSMSLDGSIQSLIREKALEIQQQVQSKEV